MKKTILGDQKIIAAGDLYLVKLATGLSEQPKSCPTTRQTATIELEDGSALMIWVG